MDQEPKDDGFNVPPQIAPDDSGECKITRRRLSTGKQVVVLMPWEPTPTEFIEIADFIAATYEHLAMEVLEEVWDIVPIPLHTGRDAALALPINPTSEEINELRGDQLVLSGPGVIEDALRDDPSTEGQSTTDKSLN